MNIPEVPIRGQTPLHMAACEGHSDILVQLSQASPPHAAIIKRQDNAGKCALVLAAQHAHLAAVYKFLQVPECNQGAALHAEHWSTLGEAAYEGHAKVVQHLLQALHPDDAKEALCNVALNKRRTLFDLGSTQWP